MLLQVVQFDHRFRRRPQGRGDQRPRVVYRSTNSTAIGIGRRRLYSETLKRFARWEIVRFLVADVPWPYPADGAERVVREIALPAMQAGQEWHWSIRPTKASDQLIGVISLRDKPDNNRGFWIAPDWQGQGFASEAAAAVTGFWFETLGRSVLRVPKATANKPSRRIW